MAECPAGSNSPCPPYGNYGIRNIMDNFMRFFKSGLPAWLRVRNFNDRPEFADMGFQFVPSASGAIVPTGTTDISIDPPPPITLISMHTVAMAQAAGASLRAGARDVTISHSWVLSQMGATWFTNMCRDYNLNIQDPTLVFRGPMVVGIVTDNLLLQQESIIHQDAFGQPLTWSLSCNASELSTSAVVKI